MQCVYYFTAFYCLYNLAYWLQYLNKFTYLLTYLLTYTYSVRAFCFSRRICRLLSICLCCIRSRKLSEIGAKFCHLYRTSGSLSKNIMSYFALEVAKYPKSSPNPKIAQNSVRVYCLAPLVMQLVGARGCLSVCPIGWAYLVSHNAEAT